MQNGNVQLVSLRTPISNGALTAAALPTRLKICGWGDNPSVKGNIRFIEHSAATLPARQKATGFDKIALDFEHNTVPGSAEFERTTEPRRVAAYGVPTVISGDGLYLESLEWTPAGKSEALNYADLSPAVELDAAGNIIFVHSVALTRNGAVEGLSFFSVNVPSTPTSQNMPNQYAAIAALLGLPETTADADVLAALKTKLTPPAGEIVPCAAPAIPPSPTLDAITNLNARLENLETTLTATTNAAVKAERDQVIARFSAEGRVPKNAAGQTLTDAELGALDVATLKLLHANTPVTVALSARGTAQPNGSDSGLKGMARVRAAFAAQPAIAAAQTARRN